MKVLILGDEERAPYHPLHRVLPGIRKALTEGGTSRGALCREEDVDVCTEYRRMTVSELMRYAAVISYLDDYLHLDGFDDVLAEYIVKGGRMLALHCGIISPEGGKLEKAFGGNFITHPPYTMLDFRISQDAGWTGLSCFTMAEEPYMVRQTDEDNHIFLEFEIPNEKEAGDAGKYPAGWLRTCQKGKVIYLAPGHDERTADTGVFQQLVNKCVKKLLTDEEMTAE